MKNKRDYLKIAVKLSVILVVGAKGRRKKYVKRLIFFLPFVTAGLEV